MTSGSLYPVRLGQRNTIAFALAALLLSCWALMLNEPTSTVTSSLVAAHVTCSAVPNEEAPPRNKTLVIVIGQTRAAVQTFDNFKTHVLEPLDADLALSVSSRLTPDLHGRDPYREAATYIWEYPEVDDWAEAYDYIQRMENTTGDWRQGLKFYEADHPLMDDKYIWVPEGEDYSGLCDRHMYLRHEEIFSVLEMLHDMFHAPKEFASWLNTTEPYPGNAETLLAHHMRKVGLMDQVRRFPRLMYLVRTSDTPTRWSGGARKQQNGLLVKYESEYYDTMSNLGKTAELVTPETVTDGKD